MQNNETFELSFNHKRDKTGRQFSSWGEQVIKGGGPGFESDLRPFATSALCPLSTTVFSNKGNFLWGVFLCGEKIKQTKPVMTSTSQKRVTYKILIKMLLLAHEHPKGRDAIQSSALCDL